MLDHQTVREILDRFEALNPYDPDLLRPWKVECESLERPLRVLRDQLQALLPLPP